VFCLAVAPTLSACAPQYGTTRSPWVVSDYGAWSEVEVEPSPNDPFSALISGRFSEDADVYAEAGSASDPTQSTPTVSIAADQRVEILITGLPADSDSSLRLVAEPVADVRTSSDPMVFVPEDAPMPSGDCVVERGVTAEVEAGVFCTRGAPSDHLYYCVDRTGTPVWWLKHPDEIWFGHVQPLSGGGFAAVGGNTSLLALFDEQGSLLSEYSAPWFEGKTRFEHAFIDMHDVIELKAGPWAGALAFQTATTEATKEGDGRVGAGIIVFQPETGAVLWDWSVHGTTGDGRPIDEKLDYDRIGTSWEKDGSWGSSNALVHEIDGMEQFFWLSLRRQDWLIKIDVETDAVIWRLGRQGDFALVSSLDDAATPLDDQHWMYQQHAPEIQAREGARVSFLVFDNGLVRIDSDGEEIDAPQYSRVVEFTLDESAMQATIAFTHGSPDPHDPQWFYADGGGDADMLGGGGRMLYVKGRDGPYISEISYPSGEERWRYACPDRATLYRAAFYPSIYDLVWWSRVDP